jgi:hypothetical protein
MTYALIFIRNAAKDHHMKLALTIALVTALQALILATPALAQSGHSNTVRIPPVVIVARAAARPGACYVRPLLQGSGNVRICG